MFELPIFTPAIFKSLNVRAEMHGQEPVPAADIGFKLTGTNKLLNMLDQRMRTGFYKRPGEEESDEPELDGIEPVDDLAELRITHVKFPIKLSREFLGRIVTIDYGLGGKSNIELASADVNEFSVDCKDGGTVEIDFRVQVSGLGDKVLGTLATLVKHEVKLMVMSSESADGTQEKIPTEKQSPSIPPVDNSPGGKAAAATDAFVAANKKPPAKKAAAKKKPAAKKVAAKKTGKAARR